MKTTKIITAFLMATLVMALLTLFGCGVKWRAKQCRKFDCCEAVKDSVRIKDSTYLIAVPYTVNADTATVQAWLECDSAYRITLKRYHQVNGQYVHIMTELADGKYTVYSYVPGRTDTVYAKGRTVIDHHTRVLRVKVNELTRWQQWRLDAFWPMLAGNVLFLVVLVVLVWRWIKRRFVR